MVNTFIPSYYRVTISALEPNIIGSDWTSNGLAPDTTRGEHADGFIDNTTPDQYGAAEDADFPVDLDRALEKERANMRWEHILTQVSNLISPLYVLNITKTGTYSSYFGAHPQDAPPDIFEFTLVYDRPGYLYTPDEDNDGEFLEESDAIKRWVANALARNIVSTRRVYNPDTEGNTDNIIKVTAGALDSTRSTIEENITVEKVDFT